MVPGLNPRTDEFGSSYIVIILVRVFLIQVIDIPKDYFLTAF